MKPGTLAERTIGQSAMSTVDAEQPSARMDDDDARTRAVHIVVRSLYRELVAQGFDDKHIVAVAIELLGKVTDKAKRTQRRA